MTVQIQILKNNKWQWCCNVADNKAQPYVNRKNRKHPNKKYRIKP